MGRCSIENVLARLNHDGRIDAVLSLVVPAQSVTLISKYLQSIRFSYLVADFSELVVFEAAQDRAEVPALRQEVRLKEVAVAPARMQEPR